MDTPSASEPGTALRVCCEECYLKEVYIDSRHKRLQCSVIKLVIH